MEKNVFNVSGKGDCDSIMCQSVYMSTDMPKRTVFRRRSGPVFALFGHMRTCENSKDRGGM